MNMLSLKEARAIAGSLGFPSKMPGTSYGISAQLCRVGAKLREVPGSTCHECYALKGRYGLKDGSIEKAHAQRLAGLAHPRWADAMVALLHSAHGFDAAGKVHRKIKPGGQGWHRWHDSGDLQSLEHLCGIVQVAARTPAIQHWLPTREAQIVARFLAQGGEFPENLCVRVSATMVDGAPSARFPQTSTVHKAAPARGHVCPAPEQGGMCGACRACWSRDVANTSYHVH